ncbi:NAD-dependent protein deacetylase sirtuin-7 isoform X2 [Amia ocellicauda]|uniref:NAD-dependent protein deacetylase sirtuin-7 isoform X2 n=1 Tax=Amia ocellicauda TaxID=2972642 RepID=UPI003464911E
MEPAQRPGVSARTERKAQERAKILQQENKRNTLKLVSRILKKSECERTEEELSVLQRYEETVQELTLRQIRRDNLKRKQEEVVDSPDELLKKVKELSAAVREANYLVVYTGAGISTAASIPDYRGPNGVWTLLQKGRPVSASDLSEAEPTLTHMCIRKLYEEKLVQHVVSQNCDGLHLRSGLPREALSELHGNMFIEVCTACSPPREFIRLFDVTERTSLHRHGTGRSCPHCGAELRDTIVHFGERGTLEQPLNWKGAAEAAGKADLILCLGSSLKWTPKDDLAALKIHGKCDDVIGLLMKELDLQTQEYDKLEDPIFSLATALRPEEEDSHSRKLIVPPAGQEDCSQGSTVEPGGMSVQGGWYGRGCAKGRKKKKPST